MYSDDEIKSIFMSVVDALNNIDLDPEDRAFFYKEFLSSIDKTVEYIDIISELKDIDVALDTVIEEYIIEDEIMLDGFDEEE